MINMFFTNKNIILCLLIFLLSCSTNISENIHDGNITKCTSPRPQICTLDYKPVCGFENDGFHSTYSNACGACANSNVTSYTEGECN